MANNLVQKQLDKMFRSYFYIGIIKRAITMYYLCIVEKNVQIILALRLM